MGIYPPNRPTRPTFLNVVAVDNHGRPVKDLRADDFRITDDGKPQKIVFFRHKDSASWQVPAPLPNQSSNRTGANVPHATVILFDLLNESFGTRGVVRGNWNAASNRWKMPTTSSFISWGSRDGFISSTVFQKILMILLNRGPQRGLAASSRSWIAS